MQLSPLALPSAAPEVENAITLQKSQDVLEGGEKKTMVKKMMVREPHLVCGIGLGGVEVPSLPTDEVGGCGGRGQMRRQDIWTCVSASPPTDCSLHTQKEPRRVLSLLWASLCLFVRKLVLVGRTPPNGWFTVKP